MVVLAGASPGQGDEKDTRKAVAKPRWVEQALDLRIGFSRTPFYVENARIYKEPFGSVMYWGPETLGRWAEIQYRFDFPFAVEEVACGLGVTVYNRNMNPNFDDNAQGTVDISTDGKNWSRLYSSVSGTGIKKNPGALRNMRGARRLFVKARLFATKSLNGNQVQVAQFLRGEPEKGNLPVITAISLQTDETTKTAETSQESTTAASAPGNDPAGHSVFPGWRQFAVHQRRSGTGCIATCYEMLLRAAEIPGVNYDSFQDDFDLDINLGRGQPRPRNNFKSVAEAVRLKYPNIHFEEKSFAKGKDKVAFIDECLARQKPVLLSLTQLRSGLSTGWHIMPIVDATAEAYLLLRFVRKDGTAITQWTKKSTIARIHDEYQGGKEVAFLKTSDHPK